MNNDKISTELAHWIHSNHYYPEMGGFEGKLVGDLDDRLVGVVKQFASTDLPRSDDELLIAALQKRNNIPDELKKRLDVILGIGYIKDEVWNVNKAFDAVLQKYVIEKTGANDSLGLDEVFSSDGMSLLISSLKEKHELGYKGNIGDNFGLHLVRALVKDAVNPFGLWAPTDTNVFMTIGSYIQHARDRAVVWGSGIYSDYPLKRNPVKTKSTYLGVRGPRTREQIFRRYGLNPPVIGDPGILFSNIVRKYDALSTIDREYGYIVHGIDLVKFKLYNPSKFLVRNNEGIDQFLMDIGRCEKIVTTSLHGLIFSLSLEKDVVLVDFGSSISGGNYKFLDFFQSLNVYEWPGRLLSW